MHCHDGLCRAALQRRWMLHAWALASTHLCLPKNHAKHKASRLTYVWRSVATSLHTAWEGTGKHILVISS